MKKEIILNTNLCFIIVPDTYQTYTEETFTDGYTPEDTDFYNVEYNNEEMGSAMCGGLDEVWSEERKEEILQQIGLKFVRAQDFGSPAYYNYGTDWCDLVFETLPNFSRELIQSVVAELSANDKCKKFLEDNYSSCSGFISWTPDDFSDLYEKLMWYFDKDRFDAQSWGALIMVMLYKNGIKADNDGDFYVMQDVVYGNYTPYEFKKVISDELQALYDDDDKCSELYHDVAQHSLMGYKEFTHGHVCDNHPTDDLADFILWAHEHKYTVEDLERIARGE